MEEGTGRACLVIAATALLPKAPDGTVGNVAHVWEEMDGGRERRGQGKEQLFP